jgi:hypothetical protein
MHGTQMHNCSLCAYGTTDDVQFIEHLRAHQVLTKGDADVLAQLEKGRKVGGHDGASRTGPPEPGDQSGGPGDAAPPADMAVEQEPVTARRAIRACWCCCNHVHNRRKPGEHCAECFGSFCFGGWHDGDGPNLREDPGPPPSRWDRDVAGRAPYLTAKGWRHGGAE